MFRIRSILAVALLGGISATLISGCSEFQRAPDSPEFSRVVQAAESVLKERFYQTKMYASSGHGFSLSAIEVEGSHSARYLIDVYVSPEITGHYMPDVRVRRFVDISEPELQRGDGFRFGGSTGPRYTERNWIPLYNDASIEDEIRTAILAKLGVPVAG